MPTTQVYAVLIAPQVEPATTTWARATKRTKQTPSSLMPAWRFSASAWDAVYAMAASRRGTERKAARMTTTGEVVLIDPTEWEVTDNFDCGCSIVAEGVLQVVCLRPKTPKFVGETYQRRLVK